MILSNATIYAEVGEIFAGVKPSRVSETTVFKSVGIAVEDIAAAKLVFDAASSVHAIRLWRNRSAVVP